MNSQMRIGFFCFVLILFTSAVNAAIIPSDEPMVVTGAYTSDITSFTSLVLQVFVAGTLSDSAPITQQNGNYYITFGGHDGSTVSLRLCGSEITTFAFDSYSTYEYDWDFSKLANGQTATCAAVCSSGTYCASTSKCGPCATGGGGGGGSTSPPPASPSAPSGGPSDPEWTDVTDPLLVAYVSSSAPEGWADFSLEQHRTTTSESFTLSSDKISAGMGSASDPDAVDFLQRLLQGLGDGSLEGVPATVTLTVFRLRNPETGEVVYRTKVEITFSPDSDLENIEIVEIIPKSVASSVAQLYFPTVPEVLQSDPIVRWTFDSVKSSETKTLSYYILKRMDAVETQTLIAGSRPGQDPLMAEPVEPVEPVAAEEQETPPYAEGADAPVEARQNMIVLVLIIFIVLCVLVLLFLFRRKKQYELF